jgi:replicative DNA helicase
MAIGGYTNMRKRSFEYTPTETVEEVNKYPFAIWDERGIRPETFKRFGVRMARSSDGLSVSAIYYPFYSQDKKVCGYKKRDLTKDKHERGHFTVIGHVGIDCMLFGQNLAKKSKKVFIVEGENDVLASYQAMKDFILKGKPEYRNMEPPVVGLSCGTANAAAAVATNIGFINSFDAVVLGLDNDEANLVEKRKGVKKGKEATEDVAGILMRDNIFVAHYEDGFKDPNDYLMQGKSTLLANTLMFTKNKYVAEKVVGASSFSFEEIIAEKEKGVYVESFPKVMDMIYGIRKREMIVITSMSGVGKSYFTSEIGYSLLEKGATVGAIFLEEEGKETVQRIVARKAKINFNKFRFACKSLASIEQLRQAYDWTTGKDIGKERLYTLNHFGSLRINDLMNKIKYLTYVCKCDYILLDHLSAVLSGQDSKDERKEFDILMTELAAFVSSNDVGIIAVSHLNRNAAEEIRGLSNLKEPKWICTKKEDLRGSASLEQFSWIILGIDFEVRPDRTRGRARITVLKNRPLGTIGVGDVFILDNDTGLFINADIVQKE